MKIIHTSDWHLGKQLHEHSLIEDQKYILHQLLDFIQNNPHDALIIAGDIYDRSIPSADSVGLLSWFLSTLRSFSTIAVFIIPGNHDSASRLSFCSEIFALSNIYFRFDPHLVDEPVSIVCGDEHADFYLLPFLDPLAFDFPGEGIEKCMATHETVVATAMDKITKKLIPEHINILTAHLFARGGLTSDSERRFVGSAGDVDFRIIDHFDYVALGHLHHPQEINKRIYYSGSLLKYSFSESSDKKKIISIDINKKDFSIEYFEFTPLRDMKKVKGTLDGLLHDVLYDEYKNCYLDVELEDGSIVSNPVSILRDSFPFIMTVRQKALFERNKDVVINFERCNKGIENDFIDFHEFIYSDPPNQDEMNLFIQTLKKSGIEHETS